MKGLASVGFYVAVLFVTAACQTVPAQPQEDKSMRERVVEGIRAQLVGAVREQAKRTDADEKQCAYALTFVDPKRMREMAEPLLLMESKSGIAISNDVRATVIALYLFKESRWEEVHSVVQARKEFQELAFTAVCQYFRDEKEMTRLSLPLVIHLACGGFEGNAIEPRPNEYGRIAVDSAPSESDVVIDMNLSGQTNNIFAAVAKSHDVVVKRDGFVECTNTVKVRPGCTERVVCSLTRKPLPTQSPRVPPTPERAPPK